MAKKQISNIVSELTEPFFTEHGYELFNTEFVKEGKDWFLRIYIDKIENGQYVSVGIDDCETVSRFLSAELDQADPIEQNYYLEVSSPGMDRPLLQDKDFVRFQGEPVEVNLYKAIEGKKQYFGTLMGLSEGNVTVCDEKNQEIVIPKEQISKTRLAVVF